jgi:DNA-binding MarR family transcriptional regulator
MRSVTDVLGGWIADDFQAVFWATKRALAEATNEAYGRHGVHAGQQFILACLWDTDGLTPGQIAKTLGLSTPTVTRTTARMEAAGLLTRSPDPLDRRLVRVLLTERGRQLRQVLNEQMVQVSEHALAGLSPAERATLVGFLQQVRDNLTPARLPPGAPLSGGRR